MKRVAIISDMYYPDMSSPSAVIDKYVQSMKGENYEFHIFTITYEKNFLPLQEKYVKVHYIHSFMSSIRAWCVCHARTGRLAAIAKLGLKILSIRTALLAQYKYPLANSWEIHDYLKLFSRVSLIVKFDAVISVSNTIFSQFTAKRIKEIWPEIRWITFFTDPFTDHYIYYPILKNKSKLRHRHYIDEMNIYNSSDYNMLTPELYKRALAEFHQPTNKTFLISFVLSDIRKLVAPPPISIEEKVVKVIYAGAIYKKIRNPELVLSVFSQLDDIILDLYTKGNECNDILARYQSEKIHSYPCANRSDYLRMICYEYDILINIGNESTLQTPSKPLELLSTGKPIINFYKVKDSQYELFERYPLGLNLSGNEPNIYDIVHNFCLMNKGKQLNYECIEELFPENLLVNQTKLLAKLLNAK